MIYKGPPIEFGVKINGVDIANLDQTQVKEFIDSLPSEERKIIETIIKSKNGFYDVPENYAKNYGRPLISERPYMTCENDGLPYLKDHSPSCNGKETYSQWPLIGRPKICYCAWIGVKKGSEKAYLERRNELLEID